MRPGGDLRTVTEATFTRAFAEVNPKLAREVLFDSQLHHAEQTTYTFILLSIIYVYVMIIINNMCYVNSVNPSLLSHFKEFLRLCEQLDDLRKVLDAIH